MSESQEDVAARTKAAEEQNKRAQEEAQRQIDEERERNLQAQRDAVGKTEVSTRGMTFAEAAERLKETPQPPNPFQEPETEPASTSGTPPPLTETTPNP